MSDIKELTQLRRYSHTYSGPVELLWGLYLKVIKFQKEQKSGHTEAITYELWIKSRKIANQNTVQYMIYMFHNPGLVYGV